MYAEMYVRYTLRGWARGSHAMACEGLEGTGFDGTPDPGRIRRVAVIRFLSRVCMTRQSRVSHRLKRS